MASTSQMPVVIGYLLDTFAASNTLGAATPPVAVFCGPEVTENFSQLALWVGVDDPVAAENGDRVNAGTSDQEWAGIPARLRNETMSVFCIAEAWSGDIGTRAAMTSAYGIVAAVETILLANVGLGDSTGRTWQFPGSTSHEFSWAQGRGGIAAHVSFRIDAKVRIGG